MEDTLTMEQENEALIQEALRDAKQAQVPNSLSDSPVIHRGNGTLEAPMTVREISGAGYYYVWDTRTYEKIPVLAYMLSKKLRQRRSDGSFRFTTIDPKKEVKQGSVKCLLHPRDSSRSHFDELGFPVCKKENIKNKHELNLHMSHKHRVEWESIQEEKKDAERQEDRQLQQMLLRNASSSKSGEEAPLYVSDKDRKKKK